jgi:electron transfer flavoprotein alpha subunit
MTTLLIAEHDNAALKDSTNKALTAAAALGGRPAPCWSQVQGCKAVADAAEAFGRRQGAAGRQRALRARSRRAVAALVVSLAPGYDAIVAPATSASRTMPRVAALLDVHAGLGSDQGVSVPTPSSVRSMPATRSRP